MILLKTMHLDSRNELDITQLAICDGEIIGFVSILTDTLKIQSIIHSGHDWFGSWIGKHLEIPLCSILK